MFGLVRMWLRGLVALGVPAAAGWLLWAGAGRLPDPRPAAVELVPAVDPAQPPIEVTVPQPPAPRSERLAAWRPGFDLPTALLAGGGLLALLAVGGGRALWWLRLRRRTGDDPRHERSPEVQRLVRPDGTELHVEFSGPADAPPVVLVHGWGAAATEWFYLRRQLGDRCRLIAFDLPGLGRSTSPRSRDFSLDKLADDLLAVVGLANSRPVVVGHSIGGMIILNLCRRHPAEAAKLAGLVLVHTSHTNPLRMTELRWLAAPLQKPVVEPLAYLMMAFAPVVWLQNVLSYLNGSLHRSNHKQLFAGTETWGQLEFVSRFVPYVWPATYARGLFGMFRWDATAALPTVPVPTLVVAAAGDRITLPEASQIIGREVPAARLVTLDPAGHMGLIERHAEFGRLVGGFLDQCHGRPATSLLPPPA